MTDQPTSLPDQRTGLHVDDLPKEWRVDVDRGWRGLDMKPTYLATLRAKNSKGRWRGLSLPVYNDDGPIAAISDLLSMLDMGTLESCS